jgi:hypothetical protein
MLDCGAWIWILLSFSSEVSLSFHFRFFISEPGSVPRERTDYEDVRRANALVPFKLVTPFSTNFHGDFASASSDLLGSRRTTVPEASLSVLIRITWLARLCGAYAFDDEHGPSALLIRITECLEDQMPVLNFHWFFALKSALDTFPLRNEAKFPLAQCVRGNCLHHVRTGQILIIGTGRL